MGFDLTHSWVHAIALPLTPGQTGRQAGLSVLHYVVRCAYHKGRAPLISPIRQALEPLRKALVCFVLALHLINELSLSQMRWDEHVCTKLCAVWLVKSTGFGLWDQTRRCAREERLWPNQTEQNEIITSAKRSETHSIFTVLRIGLFLITEQIFHGAIWDKEMSS